MSESDDGNATPLPVAPILGYITRAATTPTRVRRVAAIGVRVVGGVYLLGAGLLAYFLVAASSRYFAWRGAITFADIVDFLRLASEGLIIILALAIFTGMGSLLMILSGPIRRGRRRASLWGNFCLYPMILLIVMAVVVCSGVAIVWGFDMGGPPQRQQLWWLLIFPPGVFAIMVLKDLCAYLLWIARNPITEKPPVDFVTGKAVLPK